VAKPTLDVTSCPSGRFRDGRQRGRFRDVKIVYTCLSAPVADSPRTLYDALVARGVDATHVWLFTDQLRHAVPSGAKAVRYGSRGAVLALESADIVIANVCICEPWIKRPGTLYLQTWHGAPIKRIHNDVRGDRPRWLSNANLDVARWDMLLSPGPAHTELLRRAFAFQGAVHETGYPRNDVLSGSQRDDIRTRMRAELGIADDMTAALYTPTWRDELLRLRPRGKDFDVPIDFEEFAERLGEDHLLLVRLHGDVQGRLNLPPGMPVRDVSDVIDTAGLYLAADLMITDYSSTMFDFAITGKPMFFFTYDLERFQGGVRGLYFDLAEMAPGPLLRTSGELIDAIADIQRISADHAERYTRFRETFCSLEDGHATDRVLDLLFRA
jgi:CDP-glycerol glycerophosphotransferase (TagB/SpsB family)